MFLEVRHLKKNMTISSEIDDAYFFDTIKYGRKLRN